ncbi:hypothetical protein, partial [Mycolicibacterium arseniciresistens]
MTETPSSSGPATSETATRPVITESTTPVIEREPRRGSRVTTAAAWVGIVAGVVFIVAVVFFSGFILGKASDGGGHRGGPGHGDRVMMHHGGPPPMMGPGGPERGGPFGPGGP